MADVRTEPLVDLQAGGDAHLLTKNFDTANDRPVEQPPVSVDAVPPKDSPTIILPIFLHQSGQCASLPSFQSDCLKVCTWLRAAGAKFQIFNHKLTLPTNRFPVVEIGDEELTNCENILEKLAKRLSKNLDAHLSPDERIFAYAMGSLEHTVGRAHQRWCCANRGELIKAYDLDLKRVLKKSLPRGLLEFFFKRSSSRGDKTRQSAAEEGVEEEKLRTLRIASQFLGSEKHFFFGNTDLSSLDVVAFAVLAPILAVSDNVVYPLRDQITLSYDNLVGFVERIKQRLFLDWKDLCCEGEELAKKRELELDTMNVKGKAQSIATEHLELIDLETAV